MVKDRLLQPDAQEKGWLLDGYPRSLSQAKALEDLGIRPDIFILLDVRMHTFSFTFVHLISFRLLPENKKTTLCPCVCFSNELSSTLLHISDSDP